MSRPPSSAPVAVGHVLASKYRVEGVLGMGGMGVVVAATHLDLEQKVALKFLLPSTAADPVIVERFLREARAAVRLKSPHVARTLDTGRLDDGCPFIVMELLEGNDLDAEVEARGAPLAVEDAASYVLQACDALAEAHAMGIIHRDLKPANLFLARGHDGRAQVKVLDFGISKLLPAAEGSSRAGSMTATDSVFGSPAYMSPEQMRSSKEVDARADIWSVGVVLYELVTCRLPFDAPTALEIGLKASQDEPLRPTLLRPDLPESFERVILRCLEKDPARRFPSIADVAAALAPFAHPRDRGIADRTHDIVIARGLRTGDAHAAARSSRDVAELTLEKTQLGLDETQLAPEKMRLGTDRTHRAVTAEARTARRSLARTVTVAIIAAVVVTGALVAQRLGRASPDAASQPTLASQPSAPAATTASPEPPDSLPQGSATTAAARSSAAPANPSASATIAASMPRATAADRPRPHAPAAKPDRPATTSSSSAHASTPDAGRFFRVRE